MSTECRRNLFAYVRMTPEKNRPRVYACDIHLSPPAERGSSLPTGISSGWPRTAQGPKFKIPFPRRFVHRPAGTSRQVSWTSDQRSYLKMLSPHGRADARKDIWPVLQVISGELEIVLFPFSITWLCGVHGQCLESRTTKDVLAIACCCHCRN